MDKTPEQIWNEEKVKIFPLGVPKDFDDLVLKTFEESEKESEKWLILHHVFKLIKASV